VRHADAFMDQRIVIGLMELEVTFDSGAYPQFHVAILPEQLPPMFLATLLTAAT